MDTSKLVGVLCLGLAACSPPGPSQPDVGSDVSLGTDIATGDVRPTLVDAGSDAGSDGGSEGGSDAGRPALRSLETVPGAVVAVFGDTGTDRLYAMHTTQTGALLLAGSESRYGDGFLCDIQRANCTPSGWTRFA